MDIKNKNEFIEKKPINVLDEVEKLKQRREERKRTSIILNLNNDRTISQILKPKNTNNDIPCDFNLNQNNEDSARQDLKEIEKKNENENKNDNDNDNENENEKGKGKGKDERIIDILKKEEKACPKTEKRFSQAFKELLNKMKFTNFEIFRTSYFLTCFNKRLQKKVIAYELAVEDIHNGTDYLQIIKLKRNFKVKFFF